VNKGKKKDRRAKIIANSSPLATNAGRNNLLALQGKEIAHQRPKTTLRLRAPHAHRNRGRDSFTLGKQGTGGVWPPGPRGQRSQTETKLRQQAQDRHSLQSRSGYDLQTDPSFRCWVFPAIHFQDAWPTSLPTNATFMRRISRAKS
jgi:hypothetical protein